MIPAYETNPGTNLANLLIAHAGPYGIVSKAAHEVMASLPHKGSSLTASNRAKIAEYVASHPQLLKALEAISGEAAKLQRADNSRHVPTHGVAELYPGKRPRGNGPVYCDIEEVARKEPGVFTYDVIQQTPEIREIKIDQLHVTAAQDERPSDKMVDGLWLANAPAPCDSLVADVNTLQVEVIHQEEEITFDLNTEIEPILNTTADIVGMRNNGTSRYDNEAKKIVACNANKFKRIGTFADRHEIDSTIDHVSPKVDGVPLYLRFGGKHGYAVSRSGHRLDVTTESRCNVKMLVELTPDIGTPEKAYLLHFWVFNVGNDLGHRQLDYLLRRKRILLRINGKSIPLELPDFKNVTAYDGLVMHSGTRQIFLKRHPTIDIKSKQTFDLLTTRYGAKGTYRPGLHEYVVEHVGTGIKLTALRQRFDKTSENRLENIIEVLNAPDYQCWVDHLIDKGLLPDNFERQHKK